ncbi:MAG TPA: response regulator [Bryobacteraceae bacterium]|nr:response regulator [Bryobacteraceae bacterium]
MAFNVLIVDDSPAMRSFIGRVLDLSGLEIGARLEADNGAEALEILGKSCIDVVLTDINMPVMNGEEFLTEVASRGDLNRVPVVVVSTDSSGLRMERMMSLGAKGYVKKPFSPESLREELERALGVAHHA